LLKQRLIVGIVGAIIAIAVLCTNAGIISIALGIVSVIGLSEIYNATGILKKQNQLCVFSYLYTLLLFIVIGFAGNPAVCLSVMIFLYGFGLFAYLIFNHETCDFSSVCSLFFQTVYVSALFGHIVLVRKLPYGSFAIWFIFVTAWLSDTLAFAVGKRFGRNKLIPAISPKKTVEGALGGLLGSVLFNFIYAMICSLGLGLNVNYLAVFFMAVIAGVMSQIGDLAASAVKREYNLKDYSNLLPGHGGVLDRFDSVLFVAPTIYYFMIIFTIIA